MAKFVQMNKDSLSKQIAEQIETLILSQELKVGERLPGEIELAEQFGSSRNVLREAMTSLKERGLIEVKPGSGAYVAQPDPLALGEMMNRFVALGSLSVYEVYEVRMALEVRSCGLAAEHADEEGISKLKELIEKTEKDYKDDQLWAKYEYKFHMQIAKMTNTTLFPVFLRPLLNIVFDITNEKPRPLVARKSGLEAHKRIVAAIESGDKEAAEQAMILHLQGFLNDIIKGKDQSEEPEGAR